MILLARLFRLGATKNRAPWGLKMRIGGRRGLARNAKFGMAIFALAGLLAGCAPLQGYPADPENTDATLVTLAPYFNSTKEADYLTTTDPTLRTAKRNEIVLARMRAYDIEFADFERRLYGDGNTVGLGSDLIGLVLAGLTATTGTAATKSALGAASAGVIGANTAINKDLYYQKTLPALLAQMEANRLKALPPITAGLKQSDADYPLMQAYIDLDAYKTAGSIPAAINAVNQSAGNAKDKAQEAITIQRGSAQAQLVSLVSVQSKVKTLTTDAQFLALAKAMQPNLASRSPQIQNLVKSLDPQGARLTGNAQKARQVINAWLGEDDLPPTNQQQWLDAISTAAKGS
jgi:hypothetical protein